jgi:fatty acid desaturase
MADPPGREKAARDHPVAPAVSDLAAEAERARTPRTPFLALAGVWLLVAAVVAVVLALALTLYFVYG